MFNEEDNLALQAYVSLVFLLELHHGKFLESEHFQGMAFEAPWIKEALRRIGVSNQGSSLLALYAMLVVPRELIYNQHPSKVEELNAFLRKNAEDVSSNYKNDTPRVHFVRHVRNSVSHARVGFEQSGAIVFRDRNRAGESFQMKLAPCALDQLLNKLQEVHYEHLEKIQR